MKRILAGAAGIFATQAMLWPDHHIVAIVVDVACISLIAAGGGTERKVQS